jgi:hypothetical protein
VQSVSKLTLFLHLLFYTFFFPFFFSLKNVLFYRIKVPSISKENGFVFLKPILLNTKKQLSLDFQHRGIFFLNPCAENEDSEAIIYKEGIHTILTVGKNKCIIKCLNINHLYKKQKNILTIGKNIKKHNTHNPLKISTLIFRMTVSVIPSCSVNFYTPAFQICCTFEH